MTASSAGVCLATASGARKRGVDEVVDLVGKHPGIDAFTAAWLVAGGEYDPHSGALTGVCRGLSLVDFARVLKVQARVQEALKRGRIVVAANRRVVREVDVVVNGKAKKKTIQTDGYCLPGVSVSPLVAAQVAAEPASRTAGGEKAMPASVWDAFG